MAEQSHKREMSEALRGDFERLRRRLEGGERTAPRVTERPSEPLVLTRPPPAEESDHEEAPEAKAAESAPSDVETVRPDEADDERVPAPSRSRLRSIFRRG